MPHVLSARELVILVLEVLGFVGVMTFVWWLAITIDGDAHNRCTERDLDEQGLRQFAGDRERLSKLRT